jgi:uncharacterized membrane protein YphA (DoxX/SURF4 family)
MTPRSNRENVFVLIRWLLGALLLWAAVSKLANLTEFLGSIYAYRLPFSRSFLQVATVVLPWVELICGLMLLANYWTESALACTLGLMIIFLVATGQAWIRGLDISCGCFNLNIFGIGTNYPKLAKFLESVGFAFIRNLALTAVTIFLLRRRLAELKATVPEQTPLAKSSRHSAAAKA